MMYPLILLKSSFNIMARPRTYSKELILLNNPLDTNTITQKYKNNTAYILRQDQETMHEK